MKPYPANLLSGWPGDQGFAQLPNHPRVQSLFPILQREAGTGLTWAAGTVKTVKQADDDLVFDRLYRRGHLLYGAAALLALPKAEHLLAILDFAFDLARSLQTFERHSLAYMVDLLMATVRGVIDDFHSRGSSERDLADIVHECGNYLGEPLRLSRASASLAAPRERETAKEGGQETQRQESASEKRPEHGVAEVPSGLPEPKATSDAPAADAPVIAPAPKPAAFDDGPEELQIPPDKIGLTSDFCEEARESLAQIGHRLVELEDAERPLPIVNVLFRAVHTVKGGARLLKVGKIEALAHRLESLLDRVRKGVQPVTAQLIDVLLEGKKLLEEMVDEVASRGPIRTRVGPCLATVDALESGRAPVAPSAPEKEEPIRAAEAPEPPAEAKGPPAEAKEPKGPPARPSPAQAQPARAGSVEARARVPAATDSIRIPTEKLDDVLNSASEVFISRIRLASDVASINEAIRHFKQTLQRMDEFSLESVIPRLAEFNRRLVNDLRALIASRGASVPVEKLHVLVNRFHQELLADTETRGFSTPEELTLNLLSIDEFRKRLQKNVEHLEQLSSRLQTGAMSFRMVPIAQLFDRFPTQVREVARQLGKKVRLEVRGTDTELDKVLIHQLADPLLHILRNSIDHGIEPPEERTEHGKPEVGHILLRAYYHGSHAVIEVRDDGRGINADRVLVRAIATGLVDAEKAANLTQAEIFDFIFAPGLSTVTKVSTLSGRGVGMDVVKTAISQVQGTITLDSAAGEGTTIRMKLPLTLAVVGILLVRERSHQFAFPIQHVDEILMVSLKDVHRVSGNTLYNHRGTTLPVTTLSNILDFPGSLFADDQVTLVILSEGDKKVGVLVEAVLGRQEVLIKNLGRLIKKAPFVMGCTILSDSRLVLILNAWDIVNARTMGPVAVTQREAGHVQGTRKKHVVLIVDDSPIQRSHLSAILTHAGYTVETADNGFEGLKRMRQRRHSAFCVDIIMPLMDGFEFVERLRRFPGHAESPVFFITGRDTKTERDRAANLGVRNYFEKPVDPDLLVDNLDRVCLQANGAAQEE